MGHWYTKTGQAAHFQSNGKDTTLREARRDALLPSVTEILKVADRPALNKWLIETSIDACLTLPRIEGESLSDFKKRALADSQEQSTTARDAGTALHDELEQWFKGTKTVETPHIMAVLEAMRSHGLTTEDWVSERTFASKLGFGGAIDLSRPGVIVDFKTTGKTSLDSKLAYLEHGMQCAAYANGVDMPNARQINIYISTQNPLVYVHEWTAEDRLKHWEMFSLLLRYWQLLKNYFPV